MARELHSTPSRSLDPTYGLSRSLCGYSGGGPCGRQDQEKETKNEIRRASFKFSEELIRGLSCNSKWEFGVRGATMWV